MAFLHAVAVPNAMHRMGLSFDIVLRMQSMEGLQNMNTHWRLRKQASRRGEAA